MNCDMCGAEAELFKTKIEEGVLNVCKNCSKHGEIIHKIERKKKLTGLKQKDFAKQISEKESLIHQMEAGHFEPPIELARKLEKALNISLVREFKDEFKQEASEENEGMTLGDIIKTKMKD